MFGLPIGFFALVKSDRNHEHQGMLPPDAEIRACLQCGVAAMEPDVSYDLFLLPGRKRLTGMRTGDRAAFSFGRGAYSITLGVELDADHLRPRPEHGRADAPLSEADALRAAEALFRSAR